MTEKRRLYKDTENQKIGGVCAGVAQYFDLDPTIVRLVWALFSIFYGVGILIYIAAWIALPDKKDVV